MLGAEVALAGVTGAGAYFVLSKRNCPAKLENMLGFPEASHLRLPPGMAQEPTLNDLDRVKLKEAFLENSDYKWVAARPGVEDNEHPNNRTMLDITWYIVECQLRFIEKHGYLLVQQDSHSGEFLGAIGLIPPFTRWWRFQGKQKITQWSVGKSDLPKKLGCQRRFQAYRRVLDEQNKEAIVHSNNAVPGDAGQWHIPLVAVASSKQHKGTGRALVEAATRLCPRPIYLACPEESAGFFQKAGFSVDKRIPMVSSLQHRQRNVFVV